MYNFSSINPVQEHIYKQPQIRTLGVLSVVRYQGSAHGTTPSLSHHHAGCEPRELQYMIMKTGRCARADRTSGTRDIWTSGAVAWIKANDVVVSPTAPLSCQNERQITAFPYLNLMESALIENSNNDDNNNNNNIC